MPTALDALLARLSLNPVLIDIGATGEPPALWTDLAEHSTYVGVGPSARPEGRSLIDRFHKSHLVDRIVSPEDVPEVDFCVMTNPIYSGLFGADPFATAHFIDPRVEAERRTTFPATTLERLVRDLALPGIDWLHTNVNGIDVPLFHTLPDRLRSGLLAVDSCLDLVDLCQPRLSGVERFPEFVAAGFWISRAVVDGPIRFGKSALEQARSLAGELTEDFLTVHHRRTPGWIFVRFLRSLEYLAARDTPARSYILLWAFALLDRQYGFCLELLAEYERRFGLDTSHAGMEAETISRLNRLRDKKTPVTLAKHLVPAGLRREIKRLLHR